MSRKATRKDVFALSRPSWRSRRRREPTRLLGKLIVPLVARRQAQKELPKNVQTLKGILERGA